MAPLVSFLSLFLLALSTVAVASPHIPRHLHSHGHRAPLPLNVEPVALPLRKRSLNKRCSPRPTNATSIVPSPTVPINVAPAPSTPSSSPPPPSSVPDTTSSSTSPYVPPATSSQDAATTSTSPPPPTTSSSPPPAETSSSSDSGLPSYLYGTQHGSGTYYDAGLGACGITNTDSDYIVAVSHSLFDTYPGANDANPNENPVCGKSITISYGGSSVSATITDRCVACAETDIDMTPTVFGQLASLSVGRIAITWVWKD